MIPPQIRISYHIVAERLYRPDRGQYESYAIEGIYHLSTLETVRYRISDVSTNREFVEHLVQLYNKQNLQPSYLKADIESRMK